MGSVFEILLVAFIAGVGGTGVGGILGSFFHKSSNRVISLLLSATSGIMIAIVCFDLLPESIEAAAQVFDQMGVVLTAIMVLLGVGVVMLLNWLIDRSTAHQVEHTAEESHPQAHDDIDEMVHVDHYNEHVRKGSQKRDLWMAGIIIACAIALHNIPEGMSVGASFAIDAPDALIAAFTLAVLIGIHNIPEGMAVAVPLVVGGMGRLKAVLLTAALGLPMVVGAALGLWLGDIGPIGLSCSLGFASGAMLYVVFGEIIPQSILMYRSRIPAILVVMGIVFGLFLLD